MPSERFDSNFWNLDYLEFRRGTPDRDGVVFNLLNSATRPSVKKAAILNNGKIIILKSEENVIQTIQALPSSKEILTIYQWGEDANLIDMSVVNDQIYLLDFYQQKIIQIEKVGDNSEDFHQVYSWSLSDSKLSEYSQMAIIYSNDLLENIAYVTLSSGEHIMVVPLSKNSENEKLQNHKIALNFVSKVPRNQQSLGNEVYICADDRNKTLIISDTENHRILEVDYQTGDTKVICGTGRSGSPKPKESKQGVAPLRANLNTPKGLALYRPAQVISLGLLSEPSRNILKSDSTGVRPRTIWISDSGNNRIIKLIELPKTDLLPASSGLCKAFTFLGGGKEPIVKITIGSKITDFRFYQIDQPIGLAVSEMGELSC